MEPNELPGQLILFEGPEGGGKSTLVKAVAERLRLLNFDVVETKEPGHNTPLGRQIREILLNTKFKLTHQGELSLFLVGREDHFKKIVIPALRAGKIVLCDRSSPSTIAYQHYGRGMDLAEISAKDVVARQNVDFDMVILLDVDPGIGLGRKAKDNRFEKETLEFHRKVRQGYLEQARNAPRKNWWIFDAALPLKIVENKLWMRILYGKES